MRRSQRPAEKSALSPKARDHVLWQLDKLRDSTITAMVTTDTTRKQIIEFMFSENTRRILREAHGVVDGGSEMVMYELAPHINLRIGEWGAHNMAPPAPEVVEIDHAKASNLLAAVTEISRILDDFASVKTVVKWLDKNASINAFRYYFPSVLSLVPEKHRVPYELSDRFVEPQGVAEYVPLIRESASIVASSLLLPEKAIPAKLDMQLQFDGHTKFSRQGIEIERATTYIKI